MLYALFSFINLLIDIISYKSRMNNVRKQTILQGVIKNMSLIDFFSSGSDIYDRLLMPVCEKHGLSYIEMTILLFLANNPTLNTAKDIVEKRHIAKSHVSVSVKSLCEKGLLRGEYRDGNHKLVRLSILPAAEDMIREGREIQKEYVKILTQNLTEEEINILKNCIQKIGLNILEKEKEINHGK